MNFVVVSDALALKKFPPAINVEELSVVPLTSIKAACVFVPSNTALNVEFKVIPALMDANPVCVAVGVNVSLDKIATLVVPAYIDATYLSPPELAIVSITNPDWPCVAVNGGPNSSHLSLT